MLKGGAMAPPANIANKFSPAKKIKTLKFSNVILFFFMYNVPLIIYYYSFS